MPTPTPTPTSTGYTYMDLGACNCSPCLPCPLPAANLTLSWSFSCTIGGVTTTTTGTATVVYLGVIAGVPTWQTACFATGAAVGCIRFVRFTIQCDPALGTTYHFAGNANSTCTGSSTGDYIWNTTTGNTGGPLSILSSSCGPLNITFGPHPGVWDGSTLTP